MGKCSIWTSAVANALSVTTSSTLSKSGFFEFLDKQGNIDSNKSILCFDLSQLPESVKTLMMFTVLQHINLEMKKDKKPKLILIDEGWSLLRSKEAAGYILEFIKTARKYNASIGFVTQEIDDLLNNESGRSVLNTASTKILMRQNPFDYEVVERENKNFTVALTLNEKKVAWYRKTAGKNIIFTNHLDWSDELAIRAYIEVCAK